MLWLFKLGITMLIHNKDDIEFVTEFPCFWDTLYYKFNTELIETVNCMYTIKLIHGIPEPNTAKSYSISIPAWEPSFPENLSIAIEFLNQKLRKIGQEVR